MLVFSLISIFLKAVLVLLFASSISSLQLPKNSALPVDSMMKVFQKYNVDENLVEIIFQKSLQALTSWNFEATPFVSRLENTCVEEAFKDLGDLRLDVSGGYGSAERIRIFFCRSELAISNDDSQHNRLNTEENFAALKFRGAFKSYQITRNNIQNQICEIPAITLRKFQTDRFFIET
jgi:capsule polysaccharide export protein KpsE/RkpR